MLVFNVRAYNGRNDEFTARVNSAQELECLLVHLVEGLGFSAENIKIKFLSLATKAGDTN